MNDIGMAERLTREIEDVHAFIAAWFRGDVACDEAVYEAGLASRMGMAMVNIQPCGEVLTRTDLVEGIRGGYGGNPDFRIAIADVVVRMTNGDRALVTYVEHQFGARNTVPADNRRVSSVWFDVSADTPVWLHIHETGLGVTRTL